MTAEKLSFIAVILSKLNLNCWRNLKKYFCSIYFDSKKTFNKIKFATHLQPLRKFAFFHVATEINDF